jgi:hypothetical protein
MQLTTYYYRIRAYNAATGTSQSSGIGQVTTVADGRPAATAQSINAIQDTAATVTVAATDGDGDPLTYEIDTLPVFGTLKQFDGTVISSVPTTISDASRRVIYTPQAGYFGSDNFAFIANDGMLDSFPATVSVNVLGAITMSPASITTAVITGAYSQVFTTNGGSGSYTAFALTSGTLPPGLTLNAANGTISGTPTHDGGPYPKIFNFTIHATDSLGFTGSTSFALTVVNTHNVTAAAVGVTFTPSAIAVTHGATTTIKVDADAGYHITGISGCGNSYTPAAYSTDSAGLASYDYTTGAVNADCAVTATTAINVYSITPSAEVVQ